jgi:prophage DNA circulation protein
MSHIADYPSAWRSKWVQAKFRDAIFYVETNARASGRRVALHEYPKRSIPYAEDMGRKAITLAVQGYCIGKQTLRRPALRVGFPADASIVQTPNAQTAVFQGRDYLTMKNNLIEALEQDGPGLLTLPMQFKFADMNVMVQGYSVTEQREAGGICRFDMNFVEYGDPNFRSNISTPQEVQAKAATVEQIVSGLQQGTVAQEAVQQLLNALKPYQQASPPGIPFQPTPQESQDIHSGINFGS